MAQSVKRPTSAQVMISQLMGLSPMSGSVLTTQSLEPASECVSLACALSLSKINKHFLKDFGGDWVAQSVGCPTSAQVVIWWFMGSSPVSGSVLTTQSLKSASDSVSPSLSAPPLLILCLCLKNKLKHLKKIFN